MTEILQYERKAYRIQAMQFKGGAESASQIVDWVDENGLKVKWIPRAPERILIEAPKGILTVYVGWWVAQHENGEFYMYSPKVFDNIYGQVSR